MVLLPDTPRPGALHVAESLRHQLEETTVDWNGQKVSTTASIGLAIAMSKEVDMTALIGRADAALDRAKNGGRNQVCEAKLPTTTSAGPPPTVAPHGFEPVFSRSWGPDAPSRPGRAAGSCPRWESSKANLIWTRVCSHQYHQLVQAEHSVYPVKYRDTWYLCPLGNPDIAERRASPTSLAGPRHHLPKAKVIRPSSTTLPLAVATPCSWPTRLRSRFTLTSMLRTSPGCAGRR